jgi:hypothetical protein
MLVYRAALPLSSRTLTFVAGLIRRHRAATGSPWRKLNPARQALLVLAYLREGDTFAELAAGFDVGTTTALTVRQRDDGPAGGPGRGQGRDRLRRRGRDLDPGRPGRRGPAVLLRQAQAARHEPAGHRQPRRRHRVGVRGAARRGARQESRVDPGRAG